MLYVLSQVPELTALVLLSYVFVLVVEPMTTKLSSMGFTRGAAISIIIAVAGLFIVFLGVLIATLH